MEIIRERHRKSREELKQLLIGIITTQQMNGAIQWNGFEFEGTTRKTTIRGEIFEDEIHIEVTGWFAKKAAKLLRNGWRELVEQGRV